MTFVVDGLWVSVGSMNFDNRSLALNDESTLMVLDPTAARRMEDVFIEDLRFAKEIDPADFRRPPWIQQAGEWGANPDDPPPVTGSAGAWGKRDANGR